MKSNFAYILAPLLGYLLAHSIKYLLGLRRRGTWRQWFQTGGMPSSHTAVVVALTSVIFFHEGTTSLFAVAATFSSIVIYDAMVARRSIGEQGKALLELLGENGRKVKIALGHTPQEVLAGTVLGVFIGFVVALFTM